MATVPFYSMDDVERDMRILGFPEPPQVLATVDPLWIMGRVHARLNPYAPTHANPNPPPRPPPPPPRKVQFAVEDHTSSAVSNPISVSVSSVNSKARPRRSSRKSVRNGDDDNEDALAARPRGSFGSARKVLGGGVSKKTRKTRNA